MRPTIPGCLVLLCAIAAAAAGCAPPPEPSIDVTTTPIDLRGSYVNVNGVRLHYVERGASTDPAIVLVHGFGGWAFSFRKVLDPLAAQGHRVIAIDLLGFGLSDKPLDADYSLTAEATLLLAALDSLHVDRPVLLGHSYGGGVVAAAALAQPSRVRAVILANSLTLKYGRFTIASSLVRKILDWPVIGPLTLALAAPRDDYFAETLREGYAAPHLVNAETIRGFLYPYHLPGARQALVSLVQTGGAGVSSPPVFPARLRVPVLVLWGQKDPWFTAGRGYQLAARIPGALYAAVHHAGHFPLEEDPATCVRFIRAFIDGLPPAHSIVGGSR